MANISDHPQLAKIFAQHDWATQVSKLRAELATETKKSKIDFLKGCLRIAENMATQHANIK